MLSKFDDYPIHQTAEPIARPASTDRNVYDRYWFNGYDRDGEFYFGIGMGVYPIRGIIDCAFSIVRDGEQHAFHGSSRLPAEHGETVCGPFSIDIVQPMRQLRVTLDDNDTGIACELTFDGRTANVEEGRQSMDRGGRRIMDSTRFLQMGRWSGQVRYDGQDLAMLLSAWGTDDPEFDLTGDGIIGGADLAQLLSSWS